MNAMNRVLINTSKNVLWNLMLFDDGAKGRLNYNDSKKEVELVWPHFRQDPSFIAAKQESEKLAKALGTEEARITEFLWKKERSFTLPSTWGLCYE